MVIQWKSNGNPMAFQSRGIGKRLVWDWNPIGKGLVSLMIFFEMR